MHDIVVISNEVAELFEDYVSSKKEYDISDLRKCLIKACLQKSQKSAHGG